MGFSHAWSLDKRYYMIAESKDYEVKVSLTRFCNLQSHPSAESTMGGSGEKTLKAVGRMKNLHPLHELVESKKSN